MGKKDTLGRIKNVSIVLALVVAIASVVAVAALVIMSMLPAAHAEGFQWRHFGAAPFATTRREAMRERYRVFLALGIPPGATRVLFVATKKPWAPATLVVGEKLDTVISKGGKVHRNVEVAP